MTRHVTIIEHGVTFVATPDTVGATEAEMDAADRHELSQADGERIATSARLAMGCLLSVLPEGRA